MFLGILSVLPLLVTQLFNVSMLGYISHILHASSVSYGITDMFYGIGGLVAGLITAKLLEKMTKKNLLIDFFLIASLALLALFIFKLNLLTFAATFLIGLSNSAYRR
ncbi:MFS transporter [Fructilactobacillus sanfranciscensis]|uniref:MFS transporter n=2 Tax=Fructilactobacillus sanfranciscensis TaxID=1625 RepID=UPI0013D61B84|nr:MFS transporter [Fructilactobacillus sanfranciscensis]NDR98214.1 hypothetical protein [Fructilactobacillus sanfranciscensis]